MQGATVNRVATHTKQRLGKRTNMHDTSRAHRPSYGTSQTDVHNPLLPIQVNVQWHDSQLD